VRVLITYDVGTVEKKGQRRLRRVAKLCENFGQRVQKSVFECSVTKTQLASLKQQLRGEIDVDKDSIRFYYLRGDRKQAVEVFGPDSYVDFEVEALIF